MAIQIPYSETPSTRPTPVDPQFISNRAATAEAFGMPVARGQEAVANALLRESAQDYAATNALSEELRRSALTAFAIDRKLKVDAEGRDDSLRTADLVELQAKHERELVERQRTASGSDAYGMTSETLKRFDEEAAPKIAMIPPGEEQNKYKLQLTRIRTALHQKAFSAEMETRDKAQITTTKNMLDTLVKGIEDDPNSRAANIAKGNQYIDGTKLPNQYKIDAKQNWEAIANYAYARGLAIKDPDAVIDSTLPVDEALKRRIMKKESGGDPNARTRVPGGTSRGLFGFIDETWASIVNSPEGKAKGLTMDGRGQLKQENDAMDILIAQNKVILTSIGQPHTQQNLYAMHFLGGKDGPKFFKALQENPGMSAARLLPGPAAANPKIFFTTQGEDTAPRSVAQVHAVLGQGMGGGTSAAVINALPQAERQKVIDLANRSEQAYNTQAEAARKAEYDSYLNNFLTGISTGDKGISDVRQAQAAGHFQTFADFERAYNAAKKYQDDETDAQRGYRRLNSGEEFNRFVAQDNKEINAAFDKFFKTADPDQTLAEADRVFRRSQIFPDSGVALVRNFLNSTNPQSVEAGHLALRKIFESPLSFAAFQGMEHGKELEAAAIQLYNRLRSYTDAEVAKQTAFENTGEYKSSIKATEPERKALNDDLLKTALTDVTGHFTSKWPEFLGGVKIREPMSGNTQSAIAGQYRELVIDRYNTHPGSVAEAKQWALKKLETMYDVQNGRLMQYPPSKAAGYHTPNVTNTNYVFEQAAAEARRVSADPTITAKDIELVPNGTLTAQTYLQGKPVVYEVRYSVLNKETGQRDWQRLTRPNQAMGAQWYADPQVESKRVTESIEFEVNARRRANALAREAQAARLLELGGGGAANAATPFTPQIGSPTGEGAPSIGTVLSPLTEPIARGVGTAYETVVRGSLRGAVRAKEAITEALTSKETKEKFKSGGEMPVPGGRKR